MRIACILIGLTLLICVSPNAHGLCDLTPLASSCDSGTSGPVNSPQGNHQLTFPAGGSGSVNGDISYGPGNDQVTMHSGSSSGSLNMGAGSDAFSISAGTFSGDINQGADRDTFRMTGGSLRNLAQGDGLDSFFMSGGTISNAFEDGDSAQMTGGTIGRVDMKLDDNDFELSGGTIVNNLVTGFGRDTIVVSGGRIGGVVSTSGGDDRISLSGGEIGGIRASFGNDRFTWQGGGQVRGSVLLAEGDDSAQLIRLDESLLATTPLLDGGPGNDNLDFNDTRSAVAGRYRNWETVSLEHGSQLSLDQPFVLGDTTSKTGILNISADSTLLSANGSVQPFDTLQHATLNNAGTLDLTGSGPVGNTLTVQGDYQGQDGQLRLRTVLGDDHSLSDRLLVSGGTLGGRTGLNISNLGGSGALTLGNGIEVVQARDGATSQAGAFTLQHSLAAGPYQYYLFQGGTTSGSEHSWYLRSSLPATVSSASSGAPATPDTPDTPTPVEPIAPAPTPSEPTPSAPPPAPSPAAPASLPASPPGLAPATQPPVAAAGTPLLPAMSAHTDVVPLYRLEVADYSVASPALARLGLITLGTFHERQGSQRLLDETGGLPAAWGRLFGQDVRQRWSGQVNPQLDASLEGYQLGHDLWAGTTAEGRYQRFGLFVARTRLSGQIEGFAGGFAARHTGRLRLRGESLGAYWTLSSPAGAYLDLLGMGTRVQGKARSSRGLGIDTDAQVLSLSAEAGYPLPLSEHWQIEPQLQLIHQRIDIDSQHDGVARIGFDAEPWSSARAGLRLSGDYRLAGRMIEPYGRINLWHHFAGQDAVIFDGGERITVGHQANDLDLGLGVVARLAKDLSLQLEADYSRHLDEQALHGLRASLGLRASW